MKARSVGAADGNVPGILRWAYRIMLKLLAAVLATVSIGLPTGIAEARTTLSINGFFLGPFEDASAILGGRHSHGATSVSIDYPYYSPLLGNSIESGVHNLHEAIGFFVTTDNRRGLLAGGRDCQRRSAQTRS